MTGSAPGGLGTPSTSDGLVPLDDEDMASGAPWPNWCHTARLDDTALAEAYEHSPAPQRACVKQCLALLHTLWGEDSEESTQSRVDKALGFAVTTRSTPAPWALFVVSADHNAPTRLAAALMPALLARVPYVAVLCVGSMPSAGTRLALELSGIQDIFCTDHASAAEGLLRELCPQDDPGAAAAESGSVALLHHGSLACIARTAEELQVPLWEEAAPPHIVDATGEAMDTAHHNTALGNDTRANETLVKLCHPDAFAPAQSPRCDAVFGTPAQETPHTLAAPLRVGKNLEGFWLHPSLTPAFFRRNRLHMTPHTGETPWAQT